jgi:hypothetical protein
LPALLTLHEVSQIDQQEEGDARIAFMSIMDSVARGTRVDGLIFIKMKPYGRRYFRISTSVPNYVRLITINITMKFQNIRLCRPNECLQRIREVSGSNLNPKIGYPCLSYIRVTTVLYATLIFVFHISYYIFRPHSTVISHMYSH